MRVCSYCHLLLGDAGNVCPHDGSELRPVDVPPLPPPLHDKFSSAEPYARGQTGTLYLATQKDSGYRGVLKLIPLAGVEASERVRLKRELRKQTQLAHDGLPRIIDGGELGQSLWLFREHVKGESLAQYLKRVERLEPGAALAITAQVASALDELQRNGLLHRDVKPGHVILEPAGDGASMAKLIDAGVAGRLPSGSVFGLLGTPAYISPEQVAGKLVSFRSDLYALGCVLFEMLSGKPPFPDHDVQAVLEAHKSLEPPALELELPQQARALLSALLAKEPRQRPFSAQQVRRTLEPLLPPGTPLPAIGTRAPAPQAQSRARGRVPKVPGDNRPTTEVLDDLELEELAVPSNPELAPKTLHLTDDEVDDLAVPSNPELAPKTLHLTDDEVDDLEVDDAQALRPAPQASAASVRDAITRDPDSVSSIEVPAAAVSVQPPAPAQPPAPPRPSSVPPPVPGRRAVDFDVETLFTDEESAPAPTSTSLQDVAPTQIYRPRPEEAAPTKIASAAPAARRDPEGTLRTKPPAKGRPAWIYAAATVLLLVLAIAVARSRRPPGAEPETAPAGAAPSEAAAKAQPTEVAAKPEAPASPAAASGAPPSAQAQPSASAKSGSSPSAPSGTQVAPSANEHGTTAAPSGSQANAAAPAANAPPAAGESAPGSSATASAKSGAQTPPSEGSARTAALPASTAAGTPTSPGERTAAIAAANAAGRNQTGSGDAKLAQGKGSRDDRVGKADDFKSQGRELYQAGKFREAAAAYEKATQQNPSDAGAFAGLAASRLAAGDAEAAVQAYSKAVRLQPDSSGFHAALGRAYLQKGDKDRARSAYQHALELNPNNGAAKTALEQLK